MLKLIICKRAIYSVICAFFLTIAVPPVFGQAVGYTKLDLKGRVQLEIPIDWTISDAEQRKRVNELAENLSNIHLQYLPSLSAQSYPQPSRIFVRVSFIALEQSITQADLRQEVQVNKQQVLNDIKQSWLDESPAMWDSLAKNGIKEVGKLSVAVEPIGGKLAMIIRYGRTSVVNRAETMNVAQYHVPLGTEKVLITISDIDGDQLAAAASKRLKNSFVIR
jgi:hypothetical protein